MQNKLTLFFVLCCLRAAIAEPPSPYQYPIPQQSFIPAPAPQPVYSAPAPAPQQYYSAPAPAPQQYYSAPAPAPQQIYSAPAPAPQQSYGPPAQPSYSSGSSSSYDTQADSVGLALPGDNSFQTFSSQSSDGSSASFASTSFSSSGSSGFGGGGYQATVPDTLPQQYASDGSYA